MDAAQGQHSAELGMVKKDAEFPKAPRSARCSGPVAAAPVAVTLAASAEA